MHLNFELLIKAAVANISSINAESQHAYDLLVDSRRLKRIANQGRGKGIQEMFYQQHVRRHRKQYSLDGRAENDDDNEREEELDYHDNCITQQKWDA